MSCAFQYTTSAYKRLHAFLMFPKKCQGDPLFSKKAPDSTRTDHDLIRPAGVWNYLLTQPAGWGLSWSMKSFRENSRARGT